MLTYLSPLPLLLYFPVTYLLLSLLYILCSRWPSKRGRAGSRSGPKPAVYRYSGTSRCGKVLPRILGDPAVMWYTKFLWRKNFSSSQFRIWPSISVWQFIPMLESKLGIRRDPMAKFNVSRSGVVLISKFKFQNFSSLSSASSKYPIPKFRVLRIRQFQFQVQGFLFSSLSRSVQFWCLLLVNWERYLIFLRQFSLKNLILIRNLEFRYGSAWQSVILK